MQWPFDLVEKISLSSRSSFSSIPQRAAMHTTFGCEEKKN